jgi:hypothetical protein
MGATTLGEAYDMLEQLEISNDVPEVLGEDDTVEDVRAQLESGLEDTGPDTPLTTLLNADTGSSAITTSTIRTPASGRPTRYTE